MKPAQGYFTTDSYTHLDVNKRQGIIYELEYIDPFEI